MTSFCVIALGGNLGDVAQTFACAIELLKDAGLKRIQCSSIFRNPAFGCPPGTPDFLNAVLSGEWDGTPRELLKTCQEIEVKCGRPAEHPHWVSRTLDLDILLFGNESLQDAELTIPHPHISKRDFVLIPMLELLGDMTLPGNEKNLSEMLKNLENKTRG